MAEQTNPAKRLYDILDATIAAQSRLDSVEPSGRVWARLFNMGPKEDFFDALGRIFSIIDSYEQFVKRSGTMTIEKKTMHLNQLREVKMAFFKARSSSWSELSIGFHGSLMTSMQWAAEDMKHYWNEEVVSKEALGNLQSEVEKLVNRVIQTNLNDQLKQMLLDDLEAIRQAILEYRIHGADGLRQALARSEDSLLRNYEDLKRASESVETRSVINEFLNILKNVDYLVSVGLKIKRLAGPVIERLMLNGGS